MLEKINHPPDKVSQSKTLAYSVMQAFKRRDLSVITNDEDLSPKEKLYAVYAIIIKTAFNNHTGSSSIEPEAIIPLIQDAMASRCPFVGSAVKYVQEHISDGNSAVNIKDSPHKLMIPFELGLKTLCRSLRSQQTLAEMIQEMSHPSELAAPAQAMNPNSFIKPKNDRIELGLVDCPIKHAGVAAKIHHTLDWKTAFILKIKRRLEKLGIL